MSNDTNTVTGEKKKCGFDHNQKKFVAHKPVKLVRNDPYPCPECERPLYITIEKITSGNLMWNLIISEEKQPENE